MLSVRSQATIHLGYFCLISWAGYELVSCNFGVVGMCHSWKEERLAVAPVRRGEKGFVLPDELIHSESKQIQVSAASLKSQRRVELKILMYNKLPMGISFYF